VRIEVAKIESQTLTGEFGMDAHTWQADGDTFVLHDCTVRYEIYRINATDLHLTERYAGKVDLTCSSCLCPFEMDIKDEFSILLTTAPGDHTGNTDEGLGDEAEPVDGDFVEFDRYVLDTVQLNMPISCKCAADCKGICSTCGVNLNEETCSCSQERTDPRWNALESLLDKKE